MSRGSRYAAGQFTARTTSLPSTRLQRERFHAWEPRSRNRTTNPPPAPRRGPLFASVCLGFHRLARGLVYFPVSPSGGSCSMQLPWISLVFDS